MRAIQPNELKTLKQYARQAMLQRGLLADFSAAVKQQLSEIRKPASDPSDQIRDLRDLLWASIDNDDSRDLDQLTTAVSLPDDKIKVMVAVADVDAIVKDGSAIDLHARHNTSTVYTAVTLFPMLPELLSTDLTSLNDGQDRLAMIIEMTINKQGALTDGQIFRATVRNHAKLAYNSMASWLDEQAPMPDNLAAVSGLPENIQLQDLAAGRMKNFRHLHGALSLTTIQAVPVFDGTTLINLDFEQDNRAKDLIEDFMIVANGVTARFLSSRNLPVIRRVVRTPKRWGRIVELAAEFGGHLPQEPDPRALEIFLQRQKQADPLRFPDLSLSIVKLIGAGEYCAECPQVDSPGHFGLAVNDYTHSTAPNRRYPDLITQRLVKAALMDSEQPYTLDQLQELAEHFTRMENEVNKVERQVNKSVAAMLFKDRIGNTFEALVTGASEKGTWVRLIQHPIEGKLVSGQNKLDVGDRIKVKLKKVNVSKGFIDFVRVS